MSTHALVISLLSRIALNSRLMAESSSTDCRISTPAPRARRRAEMRQRDNERRCARWVEKLRVLQASADQLLCRFSNLTEDLRAMPGAAHRSSFCWRQSQQPPKPFCFPPLSTFILGEVCAPNGQRLLQWECPQLLIEPKPFASWRGSFERGPKPLQDQIERPCVLPRERRRR